MRMSLITDTIRVPIYRPYTREQAMKATTLLSSIVLGLLTQTSLAAQEVNVYSYRQPTLVQPMLDVFTDQTGIQVNMVYAKKGMLERLKHEGKNTPADLIFTTDIGRLADIKAADLTRAVESDVLNQNIPQSQRDEQGHWYGLTARARIIVASKSRASGEIDSYAGLASAPMKGRVCTRSGKHPYMVGLTAAMIVHEGAEKTEQWLHDLKQNLARKPQGNDRAQVKAIKEGECDVAVINNYYMYKMLKDPKQLAWAESVEVIFPDQAGHGTHMNISGMVMSKYATNQANALKLMEFLASDVAQKMYSEVNGEYPVKSSVPLSEQLNMWGEFKRDEVSLTAVAAQRAEAIKMMDRVGFDD